MSQPAVPKMELLPVLAIPVLRTPDLRRTAAYYQRVFGFSLAQEIPGVLALLRHGEVQLQLWQAAMAGPQDCRIQIDGTTGSIFDCHARMARTARAWIGAAPVLKPWGAWEFSVTDADGNRLVFVQWAAPLPPMDDGQLRPVDGRQNAP